MIVLDVLTVVLIAAGILAFGAGVLGFLRFPDLYTRLHALTKADNLGLGLVLLGLACQLPGWVVTLKFLFIWLLVAAASTVACHLVAKRALEEGVKPWRANS